MSFKIMVLADLHLPSIANSAQEAVLDWAMDAVSRENPDLVLAAGDMTATGVVEVAKRVRARLESLDLPFRMIPGNSDVRTPADREATCKQLTCSDPFVHDACLVLSLTGPEGRYSVGEREDIQEAIAGADGRQVVIMAHSPPAVAADYSWLRPFFDAGAVHLHIAGHRHRDIIGRVGLTETHIVRGLDPDKAIGGAPAIVILEYESIWQRREVVFPGSKVDNWSPDLRQDFLDHLGFSCMADSLGGLTMACEQAVRCVELRAKPALLEDRASLTEAVHLWRTLGNTTLSIHLPNLLWDAPTGRIGGREDWEAAILLATELEAEALTIHPPQATVKEMESEGEVWCAMRNYTSETLKPLIASGSTFCIENLHLNDGDTPNETRRFGCLPQEVMTWIECLRGVCEDAKVGANLDIGHARNNPPFSKTITLSSWYAKIGHEISGYHLHQVLSDESKIKNHQPIEDVFGPLISFASFFWAWEREQIRHAPMYIEVRGGRGSILRSLECMRGQMQV